jgi:hypothetical protein
MKKVRAEQLEHLSIAVGKVAVEAVEREAADNGVLVPKPKSKRVLAAKRAQDLPVELDARAVAP